MSFTSRSQCLRQNYYVVWLDENDESYKNFLSELQQVTDTVDLFVDIDECIDSITDRSDETVYMIVSRKYVQQLSLVIGDISQLKSIYIFNQNNAVNEPLAHKCSKIHEHFSNIASICDNLKQALKDNDDNDVSISFAQSTSSTSDKNKDTLDCTFMYTQILKEILLTIHFDEQNFNDFLTFCRNEFKGKTRELRNVDEIQKDYRNQTPIWWYTREIFLYKILNKALRFMDIDIILQMGFFVCDLHKQIAVLHAEQFTGHTSSNSFVVYRGQGMSQADFDQMKQNKGGLLAFNNFLSTSKRREVSLRFIRPTTANSDLIPVLFIMNIDPTIIHTPFANIANVSAMKREDEILFSMHSVFRIGEIERFDNDNQIRKVKLIFTSDNDPDLRVLTEKMREEIQGPTGRYRLGFLMIKLNKFDQAKELYELLLKETTHQYEKARCFHQLAGVYTYQGKYEEAAKYNHKSLEIKKKGLPVDHPHLAITYNSIGMVCYSMGEYTKALEYNQKSLEIRKKSLPVNHLDLATSYNNIGGVYQDMGEYTKALEYTHKSLETMKKSLPVDHPDLASSYGNIGMVYQHIGEFAKALDYNQKSLEIRKKSLPVGHPSLATSYNNIGMVYQDMGEYPNALEYLHKSLETMKKSLPADHPLLATSYSNIGMVYEHMGEFAKALDYNHKSLEIRKKSLPVDHPDLATSYNNIGMVYQHMGEYPNALEYLHKSLETMKKSLPVGHPSLAISYGNIGMVYHSMNEYDKALEYFHKSLEIREKTLPSNHETIKILKEKIEALRSHISSSLHFVVNKNK